jgi:hypothetical protein
LQVGDGTRTVGGSTSVGRHRPSACMMGRFRAARVRTCVATTGGAGAASHPYVSNSSANSHLGAIATVSNGDPATTS